jgi:hypothetical protein
MGAALTAVALLATANGAPLTYTTFGETVNAGPNTETLISDAAPGYGGLDFALPGDSIELSDIQVLQTTVAPEAGDTCAGGSPRFQLNVDSDGDGDFDGNIFVYVEVAPGACPPGGDTGNLVGAGGPGDIPGRYDTSQLVPGTQISTYSATEALFALNPTWSIIGIQLVADASWSALATGGDGRQAVTVSPTVDVNLGEPGTKDDCKNGGWQFRSREDGTAFKNQGDCIQYVNTGK